MDWIISKNEWYRLPVDERKLFEFVSDEKGCYFKRSKKEKEDADKNVDDFERLFAKKEG